MNLNETIARTLTNLNLPLEILETIDSVNDRLEESNVAPGILLGEKAPDFSLSNSLGDTIHMSDYLAKGPVVISFFRGEWCPICNVELDAQQEVMEQIAAAGATLLAISPQKQAHGSALIDKHHLTFELLSDPYQAVIQKYHLQYTLPEELKTIHTNVFDLDIRNENADHSYNLPVPATFVLDQKGIVVARFVSQHFNIRMEPADIVSTVHNLTQESDTLPTDLRSSNELLRNTLQELRRTQAMLIHQERRAIVGSMVGGLSHEIRNLLNPVSFLEAIYDEVNPEHQEFFDYILDSRERIMDLIEEVRLMVKGEESRYQTSGLDLQNIIKDAVLLAKMDPDVKSKKISIAHHQNSVVVANKNKIVQVLLNLIRNAAQALEGCEHGQIIISTHIRDNFAYIDVADNGHGIDEKKLRIIWEPFFSTKGTQGTGLGLDICKNIIEGHGGKIYCHSEANKGAKFSFTLPLETCSKINIENVNIEKAGNIPALI
ncbi:MAG: redoxin domain-containing protein [Gammaproteobacteria bacterium]|nr:redoxin domain-containing protein [Gammaproteobacteria bacterium]